eukprot:XP_001692546.1 predicted protein [Chlamydomonas reinhardtii]
MAGRIRRRWLTVRVWMDHIELGTLGTKDLDRRHCVTYRLTTPGRLRHCRVRGGHCRAVH